MLQPSGTTEGRVYDAKENTRGSMISVRRREDRPDRKVCFSEAVRQRKGYIVKTRGQRGHQRQEPDSWDPIGRKGAQEKIRMLNLLCISWRQLLQVGNVTIG